VRGLGKPYGSHSPMPSMEANMAFLASLALPARAPPFPADRINLPLLLLVLLPPAGVHARERPPLTCTPRLPSTSIDLIRPRRVKDASNYGGYSSPPPAPPFSSNWQSSFPADDNGVRRKKKSLGKALGKRSFLSLRPADSLFAQVDLITVGVFGFSKKRMGREGKGPRRGKKSKGRKKTP